QTCALPICAFSRLVALCWDEPYHRSFLVQRSRILRFGVSPETLGIGGILRVDLPAGQVRHLPPVMHRWPLPPILLAPPGFLPVIARESGLKLLTAQCLVPDGWQQTGIEAMGQWHERSPMLHCCIRLWPALIHETTPRYPEQTR